MADAPRAQTDASRDGGPLRILLAEDNPADVYLIRVALTEQNLPFELRVAEDGAAALSLIGFTGSPEPDAPPHVILLDLNMPKHDGREVLRAIRQNPHLAGIPIAILSSSESPKDVRETEELGATCYLRKPGNLDEFMKLGQVIRELAGR